MRFILFCLLFMVSGGGVVGEDACLGDREWRYIQDALDMLHIEEEELGFEKRYATDSLFRIPIVDSLMADPLHSFDYADQCTERLENSKGGLDDLMSFQSEALGFPSASPLSPGEYQRVSIGGAPAGLALSLNHILAAFESADRHLSRAFQDILEEEKSRILLEVPVLWADDDDTTDDYLEGILHREWGLAPDTSTDLEIDTLLAVSSRLDMHELGAAGIAVARGLLRAVEELRRDAGTFNSLYGAGTAPDVEGGVVYTGMTRWGRAVIGGPNDNTYHGDFAIIVDLGGDDRYYSRSGGAVGYLGSPLSAVVDLEGDDLYSSDKIFSMGSAVFGVGALMDVRGDDTYRATHYSFGTGVYGVGMMYDGSGDDLYDGGFCVQGAGNFGYGLQIDMEGSDTYRSHNWAQGFGSVWGHGLLADYGGSDIYYAGGRYIHHPLLPHDHRSFAQGFGMGWRPYAGGGVGLLYDKNGNDFYNAEVFAQATSYWYSVGMLLDRAGSDRYLAAQYAQASGIHLAVGILVDSDGDDHYVSKYGPGQGEGHDFAVGVLLDKHGEDSYCMSGGQGIGLTNSVGIFIDCEGKDTYATKERNTGQGSGTWARGFGSAGIFLDLMEKDSYPEMSPGGDDRLWIQGKYGAGIDVGSDSTPPEPEFEMQPIPDLENMTLEEVFGEASEWEVREAKDRVKAGREELVKRGMEAVDWVLENRMDTRSGLALRAISELADSFPDSMAVRLVGMLDDERYHARANAIYLLGQLKWKPAVDDLVKQIDRAGNKKRAAISALGGIGETRVATLLADYLFDEDEPTRISATVALGRLKDRGTIPDLIGALSDQMFTVRSAAENGLVGFGKAALKPLVRSLGEGEEISIPGKIRAIWRIAEKAGSQEKRLGVRAIRPYLRNENRAIRAFAVDGLSALGDAETLRWTRSAEEDEIVLSRYRAALDD
jgi:hypothetical protein